MLELIDIHKDYEGQPLLKGITFSVHPGETVCLLGASGSGKSTLLRIIAGLETPKKGEVCWAGADLARVPVHSRHFGLMFQDYALFPHLTVFQNIAFGLRMQNWNADRIRERVGDMLAQVNLSGFAHRRVTDLSGGEQQRVALARTLAPEPHLLMFDEPLGALDRALREDLLGELRSILHQSGVPAIYVTHDQDEAFTIADTVVLLHDGCIEQQDSPAQVFAEPSSVWVINFLGLGTVLDDCIIRSDGLVESSEGLMRPVCHHQHASGSTVRVLVRPGGAHLTSQFGENVLSGTVSDVIFRNESFRVIFESGLYVDLSEKPEIGQQLMVKLATGGAQCMA